MANLFPIVRPAASGGARNLAEADVLLLGALDRSTAGNLAVGTTTATTLTMGSATCAIDLDGLTVAIDSAGILDIASVGNLEINSDGTAIFHGAGVTLVSDGGALNITGDGAADINFKNVGGEIDVDADILTIDTTAGITMDAAHEISLDAVWASNFSVTGANLTLSTITSGTLILDAVALLDINAGANLYIDVTGNYTMDSTGTYSVDAVGASNLTIDTGNLTIATTTSGTLILDAVALLDIDANILDIDVTNAITIDSTAAGISLGAITASDFTVTGATADLTLGARAATITLNQVGDTTLDVSFAATSLIGAINENNASIVNTTLDVAYNNSAGASLVTVDAGALTFATATTHNVIVDISGSNNGRYGFQVMNGTDYFEVTKSAANQIAFTLESETCALSADSTLSLYSPSVNLGVTGTLALTNVVSTFTLEDHTDTSGNVVSIKSTPGSTSTARVMVLHADGINWGAGAHVLEIISDHDNAVPLTINDGSGDVITLLRSGAINMSGDLTLTAGGLITTTAAGDLTLTAQGVGALILTTPTIADFTNATHTHANAAGGGLVPATSITVVDAGNYYTGANAELALQEIGATRNSGIQDPSKLAVTYNATNRQFTIVNTGTDICVNGVVSTHDSSILGSVCKWCNDVNGDNISQYRDTVHSRQGLLQYGSRCRKGY